MLQCSCSWETADIHYPGLFTETRLSKAWVDRQNGTNAAHLFSHTSFFLWRGIYLLLHGQQMYPYTGLQIKAVYKPLHSVDSKPCSRNSRVWMKHEKKAPGIHQTAESAGYFACPDILHESCLHLWWCYHCHVFPLQKSNLSLGQDRWIFQDSNKASKSDCEKLQHTKLFSRDQISSQVSSASHNPSLFVSPPFMPCSLWPVDKTDELWSNFNRQIGKKVREDCSHWPWQHFQVPE